MPAHASRPRPQRPRAALSDRSWLRPAPAPPGERRHTRQTHRQPGIPPRHASIGGSGVRHRLSSPAMSSRHPGKGISGWLVRSASASGLRQVPGGKRRPRVRSFRGTTPATGSGEPWCRISCTPQRRAGENCCHHQRHARDLPVLNATSRARAMVSDPLDRGCRRPDPGLAGVPGLGQRGSEAPA